MQREYHRTIETSVRSVTELDAALNEITSRLIPTAQHAPAQRIQTISFLKSVKQELTSVTHGMSPQLLDAHYVALVLAILWDDMEMLPGSLASLLSGCNQGILPRMSAAWMLPLLSCTTGTHGIDTPSLIFILGCTYCAFADDGNLAWMFQTRSSAGVSPSAIELASAVCCFATCEDFFGLSLLWDDIHPLIRRLCQIQIRHRWTKQWRDGGVGNAFRPAIAVDEPGRENCFLLPPPLASRLSDLLC